MFIAALFTIARTWKQPKCPSSDEWIKKTWHIYTMEYYSAFFLFCCFSAVLHPQPPTMHPPTPKPTGLSVPRAQNYFQGL